jgi:hypothetical protein
MKRHLAAALAALAAGGAFAQDSAAAASEPTLIASLAVRETVTFVNAAPGPVRFGVSTGDGPWKPISLQPGSRLQYFCTSCPDFKAGITTSHQGRTVRRVEQRLESGYVYEIYYEERYATKFYAFRKAGRR